MSTQKRELDEKTTAKQTANQGHNVNASNTTTQPAKVKNIKNTNRENLGDKSPEQNTAPIPNNNKAKMGCGIKKSYTANVANKSAISSNKSPTPNINASSKCAKSSHNSQEQPLHLWQSSTQAQTATPNKTPAANTPTATMLAWPAAKSDTPEEQATPPKMPTPTPTTSIPIMLDTSKPITLDDALPALETAHLQPAHTSQQAIANKPARRNKEGSKMLSTQNTAPAQNTQTIQPMAIQATQPITAITPPTQDAKRPIYRISPIPPIPAIPAMPQTQQAQEEQEMQAQELLASQGEYKITPAIASSITPVIVPTIASTIAPAAPKAKTKWQFDIAASIDYFPYYTNHVSPHSATHQSAQAAAPILYLNLKYHITENLSFIFKNLGTFMIGSINGSKGDVNNSRGAFGSEIGLGYDFFHHDKWKIGGHGGVAITYENFLVFEDDPQNSQVSKAIGFSGWAGITTTYLANANNAFSLSAQLNTGPFAMSVNNGIDVEISIVPSIVFEHMTLIKGKYYFRWFAAADSLALTTLKIDDMAKGMFVDYVSFVLGCGLTIKV